ncbi:flotillin-like protein 1 [Aspergillus udagawae]|uniref:Flotillin-like protein 1 n=1 Tax=Aspergillus udagawae TaxID=91492 RepID=A0ABQ1A2X1_9EURO|nr:flotillin-like protein 1 [Aspergillus udagawae]GFG19055.1 flotillin-like protein 1 [Aspergillus udagawae]GFG19746.1 flotillin-like protein 1 [Aspergillus udagawae]
MRGEIGKAEKKGRTEQEISRIDADTAVLETKRKAEKAKVDSELMNRQTELDNSVESKRAETELDRLRDVKATKSKVAQKSAQENADASFYTEQKAADVQLYRQKMEADATYYRQSKEADAAFYQQKREAEGILEIAKAYGALVDVLGGPQAFLQYRMLEAVSYEVGSDKWSCYSRTLSQDHYMEHWEWVQFQ